MKRIIFAAIALLAATPSLADDNPPKFVEAVAVADKPTVSLDPNKGYVLLRADQPRELLLMKVPSSDDAAKYAAWRQGRFEKARLKYVKAFEGYEKKRAAAIKGKVALTAVRPVEPILETFEATPFDLLATVQVGPLFRFAKEKGGVSTYLHALSPGEYRIYGPIYPGYEGGICFCMGSVKFEVRAGEITDMGVILVSSLIEPSVMVGDSSAPTMYNMPDYLGDAPSTMPLDSRLAAFPIRRAKYSPVGKVPNYFGTILGRIPEMRGVLRYERDKIVDLTAAN